MKKLIALILVLTCVFSLAACTNTPNPTDPKPSESKPAETKPSEPVPTESQPAPEVMSYADFVAAELQTKVVVETYVQAHQSWWEKDGKGVITCYTQNEEGAYFLYEMACSEEEAAKLVPGTKIRVTGYKAEWSGEIEITDASFEILEGSYIAEAQDVTDLLGTDKLIEKQNQFVSFKGLTVSKISYKNDKPGDDIYVTLTKGDITCEFCVEAYLTGADTDVYKAVGELKEGDVVDLEGFLYWYEGANTHITSVTKK